MKVVIFGASGGVGAHLVTEALAAGHAVTAVSRRPLAAPPEVRVVVGDVGQPGVIADVIAGQDAVLSSLGIKRHNPANPWSPLASPPNFSSSTARAIVEGMGVHGVRRVNAVSAAGVGDSRPGLNWMMRAVLALTNVGAAYRDLEALEQVYADSGLDWCCVRPTVLTDRPASGRVEVAARFSLTASISRADVARWMVARLADVGGPRTPVITGAGPGPR